MAALPAVVPVGVAGLGRAGWELHALTLASMPAQYRVAAVCDADPDRVAEARSRFGCPGYGALAGLIADPEVELLVIALPSHLRADLAIQAMAAGKDVLVEKPFATDLASADRMIEASQATGKKLAASQNLRYTADFLKLREVIDSGKLGRILQIRIAWHWFRRRWDWQTLKEFGGGSLNNDGSHAIDQALQLMGDVEPEVFCRLETTPLSAGDAEDHVKLILRAPGAPLVDLEFSNACAYPQDTWLVMGTQGGLTGTHSQLRWRYIEPALLPPRTVLREPTPERSYNREELAWVEESAAFPAESYTASNRRLYQALYRSLRGDAPLTLSAQSVRRQIAILDQCHALG